MKRTILVIFVVMMVLSAGVLFGKPLFWAQATAVKGDVLYQETGKLDKTALTIGKVLHKGDRIAASEDARASFLLSDGSILVVKPGTEVVLDKDSSTADPSLATVAKNLSKTLLSREGDNPMMKHLGGLRSTGKNIALAPNRTAVKVDDIQFVWLSKPLVKRYAFILMGPDDMFYEETTSETVLNVKADKLVNGATYWWEVRDASMKNSITSLGSGSFTTLDAKSEQNIDSLKESIDKAYVSVPEEGDTTGLFLTYQIYRENGMNLDALLALDRIIEANPDNSELGHWRSELVSMMGLEDADIQHLAGS